MKFSSSRPADWGGSRRLSSSSSSSPSAKDNLGRSSAESSSISSFPGKINLSVGAAPCGVGTTGRDFGASTLLSALRASRGVSLCCLPLRLRSFAGVNPALRASSSRTAALPCGVSTFALLADPPNLCAALGVLIWPAGVRRRDLLEGGPALEARRNGVVGLGRFAS